MFINPNLSPSGKRVIIFTVNQSSIIFPLSFTYIKNKKCVVCSFSFCSYMEYRETQLIGQTYKSERSQHSTFFCALNKILLLLLLLFDKSLKHEHPEFVRYMNICTSINYPFIIKRSCDFQCLTKRKDL